MTNQHPSFEQLVDLPAYAQQPVPVAFEDNNGHLNVRHYLGIGSEGLDESLVGLGIPQNWPIVAGHAMGQEGGGSVFVDVREGCVTKPS